MKVKRIIGFLLVAVMSLSILAGCGAGSGKDANGIPIEMRDITTTELVREMGVGINLGNTFESAGTWISNTSVQNYETGWGSPVIQEETIKGYTDAGFGVLRVPVAWSNMMGENYEINKDYIARVKEVVEWALKDDLYVILNIHWDGGWWEKFSTEKDECMKKYTSIWTQLCEAFGDYGDYLMFESLNEEGHWDDIWNSYAGTDGKEEAYGILNEINQKFVDIVRASGEKNAKRHLLIAGYATDIEKTCDPLFKMPNDTENRMAVSIHYYTPPTFCILEEDASWGKARTTWGTEKDFNELNKYMTMLKETYTDKGIPVIMGEFGLSKKNKTDETIRLYLSSVCKAAYDIGVCPVLWDITDVFYDRTNCKMYDEELLKQLMSVKGDA